MTVLLATCKKETPAAPQDQEEDSEVEGMLPGRFSVSSTRTVCFSQGNLEYSRGVWRFAEHQYSMVGSPSQYEETLSQYFTYPDNVKDSDNALISPDYEGWIDLYGWGTSGWSGGVAAYMPYAVSG